MHFGKRIFLFFAFILVNSVSSQEPEPTENYANNKILQAPDGYILYWNYTKTDILFEIHVKTKGWAGFGISPNGGMDGSNVIACWINANGTVNFTDRHIIDRSVIINKVQNWFPLLVTSKNGYLVAKFTRKINICDKTYQDLDIQTGSPYVIFAYGDNFQNGDITYHDFRGSKTLPLISSLNSIVNIDMSTVQTTDFRINATIDNRFKTVYYCQIFQLPTSWNQVKQHLIQTITHFHHWVMNECSPDFEKVYLKNHTMPQPGNCVEDEDSVKSWEEVSAYCSISSLAWAVGSSDIQQFPEDLGYPIGPGLKYVYVQIHFDNPNQIPNLRDNSGFRLYTTTKYRKTELGMFSMATMEDASAIIIPPNSDKYDLNFMCNKNCTNGLFNETNDEVKIFSVMPHTHLTGREVYATVVRDNKEVSYIVNNRNYDFNYQYFNFLTDPVTFKRGDEIKATCVYNTTSKSNFTYVNLSKGGFGTRDEMITDVFHSCTQAYDEPDIEKFLNQLVAEGELGPVNTSNYSALNLNTLKANSNLTQRFLHFYAQSSRVEICDSNNGFVSFKAGPINTIPIDPPVCQTNNSLYYLSSNDN